MAQETVAQRLAKIALFRELDPKELAELAAMTARRTYARGQTIFSAGEPGDLFHAIDRGRIKICKNSPEGKEQILHVFGPGDMFGEAAVFTGGHYPASAIALEKSEILQLPRARLVEAIQRSPGLAFKLLATLSRRLSRFVALIEDLSLKEVPARLAAYLLQLHPIERGTKPLVELEISKGQLASVLGTIPETLSRILSRLTKEGLVKTVRSRQLRLLDLDGLEELAAGRRRLR